MRIEIMCDTAAAIMAGVEPADAVEIAISAVAESDRPALAYAAQHRLRCAPTAAAVVEAARAAMAAEAASTAVEATEAERLRPLAEAALAAYEELDPWIEEAGIEKYATPPYEAVRPVRAEMPAELEWSGNPYFADLATRWGEINSSRRAECATINVARQAAVRAANEAARLLGIAERSAMSMEELGALLQCDGSLPPLEIISDDGVTIVIRTGEHRGGAVPLANPADAKLRVLIGGSHYDGRAYAITDGVLKISPGRLDRPWAAKVADPSAVKPVYGFLDHCPGGYVCPGWQPGDVLVWGGVGGSRRRPSKERYDRLVVEVSETEILTACVDYATARRLRKSL